MTSYFICNLFLFYLFQLLSDSDSLVVCVYQDNVERISEDDFYVCNEGYDVRQAVVTITEEDFLDNKQLLRTRCTLPLSIDIGQIGNYFLI